MKAITRRDLPDEPIIGLHYVGPNAGEVMQGFGVAMKAGLTKSELQNYEFGFQLTHIGKLSGNDSGDFPETFFRYRMSLLSWKAK